MSLLPKSLNTTVTNKTCNFTYFLVDLKLNTNANPNTLLFVALNISVIFLPKGFDTEQISLPAQDIPFKIQLQKDSAQACLYKFAVYELGQYPFRVQCF